MAAAVRVRGLRELNRSLQKVNKEAAKTVRDALAEAAVPITGAVKAKEGRWPGASIGTIGPRVTARGVFVTQRKRKVTGLRPDFGALQMRRAFIPALEEHAPEIVVAAERSLDRLTRSAGL